MKNAIYVVNAILLVAVGVLFYLHFSEKKPYPGSPIVKTERRSDTMNGGFHIAYFDVDSVFNAVDMVKQIKDELSREEERNKIEVSKLQKQYNDRLNYYQSQPMSQVQSETASKDLVQLGEKLKKQQDDLEQNFRDLYYRRQQDVKTKIEDFLKEYNKTKGFAFIIKNVPDLMFYKDSVYDITADVIKGLNAKYPPKKK